MTSIASPVGVSELKARITEDMKTAMRARDTARLSTIRLLLAAIKQREVDERIALDDAAVLALIEKLVKQRRDAQGQFEAAGRVDLADKERAEIDVLVGYQPRQLGDDEIRTEIRAALAQIGSGSTGGQLMGKLMGHLKSQLAGKADMARVSALVKEILVS